MTQEPIYDYVPGQGWIATTDQIAQVEMYCGTKVWVVARLPKAHEWYTCRALGEEYDDNGKVIMSAFIERLESRSLYDLAKRVHENENQPDSYVYVTVIPCE